jgi:hypothetical protein
VEQGAQLHQLGTRVVHQLEQIYHMVL